MSKAYSLLRSLLFRLDAEQSHEIALRSLSLLHRSALDRKLLPPPVSAPHKVMGIDFPNAVGLAAGLDKNGDHIDALAALGFGFVEIGTVTPRPQPGNPKPRLFRLPEAEAIINRMGFNNKGVDYLVERVRAVKNRGVIGINIGKNFDTPVEKAVDDYLICLDKVYSLADYITVNISSPNTPGLRDLQYGEALDRLVAALKSRQAELAEAQGRYVPLVVKVAPDLDDEQIASLAQTFLRQAIDGVIATNTTFSRQGVEHLTHSAEQGGLSGRPLKQQATHVVAELAKHLDGKIPIIAVGGIFSAEDAKEKIRAGASLVQIYSGFIYQGPKLVTECAQALAEG